MSLGAGWPAFDDFATVAADIPPGETSRARRWAERLGTWFSSLPHRFVDEGDRRQRASDATGNHGVSRSSPRLRGAREVLCPRRRCSSSSSTRFKHQSAESRISTSTPHSDPLCLSHYYQITTTTITTTTTIIYYHRYIRERALGVLKGGGTAIPFPGRNSGYGGSWKFRPENSHGDSLKETIYRYLSHFLGAQKYFFNFGLLF